MPFRKIAGIRLITKLQQSEVILSLCVEEELELTVWLYDVLISVQHKNGLNLCSEK